MAHKKGHLQQAMDSIPARNNIIRKLNSMYKVNAAGFPYRTDTGMVGEKPVRTPDSVVVKKRKRTMPGMSLAEQSRNRIRRAQKNRYKPGG